MTKIYAEMVTHIPLALMKTFEKVLIVGEKSLELENELKKHNVLVEYSNSPKNCDILIHLNSIETIDEKIANLTDILVVPTTNIVNDLKLLNSHFKIVMPYKFDEDGIVKYLIFASKKLHPLADISLHKSDFIDDLDYYSSDIHKAVFVMPSKIKREILGLAKN